MKRSIRLISSLMVIIMLLTCVNFAVYAEDEEYYDDNSLSDTTPADNTVQTGKVLPKGLLAHWKFDGDLNDSSGYNNNGKAIGKITYADGVFGKAASFDGKSYIDVADSDSLDLSNAFTVSLWVFKEDMRTTDKNGVPYLTKLPNEEWEDYPYAFWEYWYKQSYAELTSSDGPVSFDGGVSDLQKWTLITFTYDGQEVKIYHNNELASTTQYQDGIVSSNGKLRIGQAVFATQDHKYKGLMDDIRIYNYAFEYEDVEAAYNEGLKGTGKNLVTPPDKMVAYYNFDGNLKDSSGFKNDGTAKAKSGGITYVDGVAGKAVKLDGKSYIEVKDSNSLDLDKAFTIETWFNSAPLPETSDIWKRPILYKYGSSMDGFSRNELSYLLEKNSDNATLEVSNFAKDSEYTEISSSDEADALADGKWYHLAFTYDGKDLKYYLNGSLRTTQEYTELIAHSSDTLRIGGNTTDFLKGMLDELKIYNYSLTASEIKKEAGRKDTVTLNSASKTALTQLKVGKSVTLLLTRKLISNPKTTIDCSLSTIVTSSNPKVLSVNKNVVKALKKGTAKVTIVNGTFTSVVTVTVK